MEEYAFDFSGKWKCTYWFPSNKNPGTEELSSYSGKFQKRAKQYVYESEKNEDGSYLFVRFLLDGDLATGTWWESTSPTGEFEGSIYCGAFQALLDKTGDALKGKWAGIGQENGKRQIYTGRIEFTRK